MPDKYLIEIQLKAIKGVNECVNNALVENGFIRLGFAIPYLVSLNWVHSIKYRPQLGTVPDVYAGLIESSRGLDCGPWTVGGQVCYNTNPTNTSIEF